MASSQEVRVYQTYSGKQIFRTDCTPIIRAGQNFALSPDGLRLAVVRETMFHHAATKIDEAYTSRTAAVEIYALPALTDKDLAAVKEAQGLAPEDKGERIDMALQRVSEQGAGAAGGSATTASGSRVSAGAHVTGLPAADSLPAAEPLPTGSQDAAVAASASGDAPPGTPRKPPTLYAPGEAQGSKSPQ